MCENGITHFSYDISFTPHEEIDHHISVRFNNEPVPGQIYLLFQSFLFQAIRSAFERLNRSAH